MVTDVAFPESEFVILCVDDEPIPLKLRKLVLEKQGYRVVVATSGSEALETLGRQRIDLVLTDLLMPGVSGTELARRAKERAPQVPVVLFSGVNEVPEDARYADLFLSKMEGPAAMCEKIGQLLAKSAKSSS
jgi:CheY-like chemotaxis protein